MKKHDRKKVQTATEHQGTKHEGGERPKETTHRRVWLETGVTVDLSKELKEQHATERIEDKTHQGRQVMWTVIAAGLVAIYTIAAIAQVCITRSAMRLDQRAWFRVDVPEKPPIPRVNEPLYGQAVFVNVGKTAARRVTFNFFFEKVMNGSDPHLDSSKLLPGVEGGQGFVFPQAKTGDLLMNKMFFVDNDGHGVTAYTLSEKDVSDLMEGRAFVATYGRVDYVDVFGVSHWVRFCSWGYYNTSTDYSSVRCAMYNDADKD